MSISTKEREYWTTFLQEKIEEKIQAKLNNDPEFMVRMVLLARQNVVKKSNLVSTLESLATNLNEFEKLCLRKDGLNKTIQELKVTIKSTLQKTFPKTKAVSGYYYDVDFELDRYAKETVREVIRTMPGYAETANLMDLKDSVEHRVMLMSGSQQLKAFIENFMSANGIE